VACCGEQVVKRPPKAIVWGPWEGGMLAGSSRGPVCLFCQWILIGSSVCKEEEGTGSFQVMQYMIYVNLGICKQF
jgi:hypothetical protein